MSAREFAVLGRRQQIEEAQRALAAKSLQDEVRFDLVSRAKRRLRLPGTSVALIPDPRKSWDVRRALDTVGEICSPDDPVLDIGSFGSAVPPALYRLGYRAVNGIDLDPHVKQMAHAPAVHYHVGDMMQTPFEDSSFCAITAISVIEHGYNPERLLPEVARLLRPGGVFFFSTDYWPQKIDTGGVQFFGMDWRIFSAEEIEQMVADAAAFGLKPVADPAPSLRASDERPISYSGFDYTFLAGALIRA